MKRLLSLLLAGSIAFALDAGVTLLLLQATPAGPFLARIAGIAAALGFIRAFNCIFISERSSGSSFGQGFRRTSVGVVSTTVNFAVYAGLLLSSPVLQPLLALTLAAATGTLLRLFGHSRFVFRHHRQA